MKTKFGFILYMIGILLLSACDNEPELSDVEIQATTEIMVQQTLDAFSALTTDTPSGIETETPIEQAQLLFIWDAAQIDQNTLNDLKTQLGEIASNNSFAYSEEQLAGNAPLPPGSLIVAYFPGADLTGLAQNAGNGTQIIAIDATSIPAGYESQFTLLSSPSDETQGFIGGYLSAIITIDYRIGIIAPSSANGENQRDAYRNGAKQFCGLCLPEFPPYHEYPLYTMVSATPNDAELQAAAGILLERSVTTIYIPAGIHSPALENYLDAQKVMFINTSPSSENSHWVASISSSISQTLIEVIPLVLNNGAQGNVQVAMAIEHSQHISDARITYTLITLEEIEQGIIDPLGK